jgi:glycosyltransferase involved in cell wall biosynthesis
MALFLGRVEREKGIDVLIQAAALARRRGAKWCLVCAGTGHIEAMRRYAQELELPDASLRFVGWVDGEAKRQLLKDCSVLVLPSLIENMPVVILEAFAQGRPVIASRVGGIPDIVTDGTDGLLVEAGNSEQLSAALVTCFERPALLQAMGKHARSKAVNQYAPDQVLALVEALYRECIESPA